MGLDQEELVSIFRWNFLKFILICHSLFNTMHLIHFANLFILGYNGRPENGDIDNRRIVSEEDVLFEGNMSKLFSFWSFFLFWIVAIIKKIELFFHEISP